MALFVRVATRGTLSAVARERNVPVSQVSRSLSRIEKQCGVRLVQRSTQGLSLTTEGQTFLGYCQRITGTLEELEAEFAHQTREVSGTVQVAVSPHWAISSSCPAWPACLSATPACRSSCTPMTA